MTRRKRKKPAAHKRGKQPGKKTGLIRKIRKPMAPPVRIEQDTKKYSRARQRERRRHEEDSQQ